jgi:hypothetical protein
LEELPDGIQKVDVIISDFIGYSLFYESLMESVLWARDKWLQAQGHIFPDIVSLYIVGVGDGEQKERSVDSWRTYTVDPQSLVQKFKDPRHLYRKFTAQSPETDPTLDNTKMTFDLSVLRERAVRKPIFTAVPVDRVNKPCHVLL